MRAPPAPDRPVPRIGHDLAATRSVRDRSKTPSFSVGVLRRCSGRRGTSRTVYADGTLRTVPALSPGSLDGGSRPCGLAAWVRPAIPRIRRHPSGTAATAPIAPARRPPLAVGRQHLHRRHRDSGAGTHAAINQMGPTACRRSASSSAACRSRRPAAPLVGQSIVPWQRRAGWYNDGRCSGSTAEAA